MKTPWLSTTWFAILLFAMSAVFGQDENGITVADSTKSITFNAHAVQSVFNKGHISDPLQLIAGRIAGLSVSKNGSDPAVYHQLRMRGANSLLNDGKPLFVINGIWGADPAMIAHEDIESFEILKDAVSLARYGGLGANGIVLINTRSGKNNNKLNLSFNSYLSLDKTSRKLDLLTADEYRDFASTISTNFPFDDGGSNTDWQDEIFRTVISQSYHLAAYGQLKQTSYYASLSHRDFPGIVLGSDRKQTGVHLHLNQSALNDKLHIRLASSLTKSNNNTNHYGADERRNVFFQAFRRNPTDPVYESDGRTYYQSDRVFQYYHPLAIIDHSEKHTDTDFFNVMLGADYEIIPDLFINVHAAYNFFESRFTEHVTPEAIPWFNEIKYRNNVQNEHFNVATSLKYKKLFGQNHRIAVEAGFNHFQTEQENAYYDDMQPEHPSGNSLGITETRLNSVIAGVEYEFGQRYFLNAFVNREGHDYKVKATYFPEIEPVKSSHWFPSAMLGWKIHNETFMRSLTFLNHLVLKAGYGIAGSHTMPVAIQYYGERLVQYPLDMEKTTELSLGLEIGMLKDRFRASAVYYTRETGNGIYGMPLPVPPYPVPFFYENSILISNKGFELMLDAAIISHSKLTWKTGFVYFKNTNELADWGYDMDYRRETGHIIGFPGDFQANFTQQLGPGAPPLVFYLPEYAGMSEDGAFLLASPTGKTRYLEMATRSISGHVIPDHELAWWNRLYFMDAFDFSFLIRYVGGHSIYNATRMYLAEPARFGAINISNEAVDFYDDGLRSFMLLSDVFLEDASYLRLDNITFGYRLQTGGENHKISARLFFSVNNAFTISDFSGFDPAYDYAGTPTGIDYFNRYPLSRSFVFGLNLTL